MPSAENRGTIRGGVAEAKALTCPAAKGRRLSEPGLSPRSGRGRVRLLRRSHAAIRDGIIKGTGIEWSINVRARKGSDVGWYSAKPEHLTEKQRKILREVALTYRRARRAGKDQSEAVNAAIADYGRLSRSFTGDKLAVSGEVNRMIAAAINVNPD
jgi:hypothetical protein